VTFRRVMLVVLPLLGAIFIFTVLAWIYRDWEASLLVHPPVEAENQTPLTPGAVQMPLPGGFAHPVSLDVDLIRRDKQGRVEMRFVADRIDHQTADSSDIERPRIQYFTKPGEIVTLMADRGHVVTKGRFTNLADIESGVLWGHVVMVHDRGTPDDSSDDILVNFEDLKFSHETFELSTDGPVVMAGLEMQLTARKLRMTLDPKTRRLTAMTFLEDIRVTLEAGDRMRLGLTGPEEPVAPAGRMAGASPASAGRAPAAAAKRSPQATRPGEAATADSDRGSLWRIDLVGKVDARQQDQRLLCDRLSLYSSAGQPAVANPAPASAPTRPAELAGAPPAVPAPKSKAKTRSEQPPGAAAAEAKFLKAGAAPPLVVVAQGPLIITALGPEEHKTLGQKRYEFTAAGAPVVVLDGPTRIVGAEVRYNTRDGSGSIIGKESPMRLDQPGRLHLTGGRLDFNRLSATAEVLGEGQLQAQVQPTEMPGQPGRGKTRPPAAEAATLSAEPATLDAVWTRGMRLKFYRLPSDMQGGTGEIQTAVFLGQAIVKQRDGILKGDELAIDFFKPLPGRGQAVQRLVGRGDVFIKNQPPEAGSAAQDAAAVAPKTTVGDIACQNLDMSFSRDAKSGDTQPKHLKATGAVAINDSSGKIRAEDLTIDFGPTDKGRVEPTFLEAFGNVWIDRADLHAEGDHVRRDLASGKLLLEGRPAKAARGLSRIEGPYISFSQTDGLATVRGAGLLEMPTTTDLRGRPRAQAEPMVVRWTRSMLYEDKRNFAQFDGGVVATTATSHIASERLWIYFADRPAKPADAAKTPAPEIAPASAPAAQAAAKSKPTVAGGDMQQFVGNKALVRVLAEKNVRAVDQQFLPDDTLRHQMVIVGDNLTYVEENRKAYMRGPGRLRILAHEKAKAGEAETGGLALDAVDAALKGDLPEGYARTDVAWTDSMAYDGATDRAYFKGGVDTAYAGRGTPGEGAATARRTTVTRIQSNDLQVVFNEKPPAAPTAARPPAPADAAAQPATPREERMTVDKFVADGNVRLEVDDRRGTAARMIYQRSPEIIRLFRGADDWARLWQENEASQEFGEIVARTISYVPSTSRVDVEDQQSLTVSPKPKPAAPPTPKKPAAPKP